MKITKETKQALKPALSRKGMAPVYCRGLMIVVGTDIYTTATSREDVTVAVAMDNPITGTTDPVGDAIEFNAKALKAALSGPDSEMQRAANGEVHMNGVLVGKVLTGAQKAEAELLVERFYQRWGAPVMGQIQVNTAALKTVLPFSAKDDIRRYLNAVALEPATHTMIGTNEHMMLTANTSSCLSVHANGWDVVQNLATQVTSPRLILLSRAAIPALLSAAGKDASFTIEVTHSLPSSDGAEPHGELRVQLGKTYFLIAPVEGKFPDWRRVIPEPLRASHPSWAVADIDLSALDWSKIKNTMSVKPSEPPTRQSVLLFRNEDHNNGSVVWNTDWQVIEQIPLIRDLSAKPFVSTAINASYAKAIVDAIGAGATWEVPCSLNQWEPDRIDQHTIVARNGPYTALLMPTRQ